MSDIVQKPVIIAVAGGSASGKTTVVDKIVESFDNGDVTVIKHDDYYKKTDLPMEERVKMNYDHPFSLDNDLMYKHVLDLLKGKNVEKPTYDFENHNRSSKTEIVTPTQIIILEGILIMEDEKIRDLCDIKLFVEADDDLRFIRRLTRDMEERGRSMESVIKQYLNTVKPMHFAFVKPSKRYADVIIPNDRNHEVAVDLIITKIKSIISHENNV